MSSDYRVAIRFFVAAKHANTAPPNLIVKLQAPDGKEVWVDVVYQGAGYDTVKEIVERVCPGILNAIQLKAKLILAYKSHIATDRFEPSITWLKRTLRASQETCRVCTTASTFASPLTRPDRLVNLKKNRYD